MEEDLRDVLILEEMCGDLVNKYLCVRDGFRNDSFYREDVDLIDTELGHTVPKAVRQMIFGDFKPISEGIDICLESLAGIEETIVRYEQKVRLLDSKAA